MMVKTLPRLAGLGVHLPEIRDGGVSFTIDSGGHAYVLSLVSDRPAGGAVPHRRDEPKRMVWLHNRSNDFATAGRRVETSHTGQVRGGTGGDVGAEGEAGSADVYGYATASGSRTVEEQRGGGLNVLHMSGSRPTGSAGSAPGPPSDGRCNAGPAGSGTGPTAWWVDPAGPTVGHRGGNL